ncbi:hypothetical protein JCM19233_818 [Vibrio astriarenae]|nr:hypothetical protein JCM19233_818 [Vibrio sp. C7]
MAHVSTKYLNEEAHDIYEPLYDIVRNLNGDYEPIPAEIETFFGQKVRLRKVTAT